MKLYISVAREEETFAKEMERHLAILTRSGRIQMRRRVNVPAGDGADDPANEQALREADLVLLLVSPSYIATDVTYREAEEAMRRRESDKVTVVPILVQPCVWHDAVFGGLQPLPRDGAPVGQRKERDGTYIDIAREIARLVEHR